nr:hypothetical protein [uncultured Halomonas sp.]
MNQHAPIDETDLAFIREVYPEWTIDRIAETLEHHQATISKAVTLLGIKPADYRMQTPKHDWPSIWYAYCACGSYVAASEALGISRQVVAYAVQKMIIAGNARRLISWNRYAAKNDRDSYTAEELNVTI